ncbi:hypothetical protein ZIOFF_040234 [Zingiber officinale]|uniref:MIT domain-containing protein n=1 Tax=Zingiber officinale TaxID=94328 RepID=A0A8J5GCB6_ZINOF|nr:hypothetical protein ZIOFF_040234 [Zingiber officinale]
MYSNFKEQAIEYVKQAVQEDNAGNYVKAFPLYMNALEYFRTHLKYEKNPKIKEAITQKFTEYLRRAEEIRAVLDDGGGSGPAANGDAAVATRPKAKPKDGEGGGEDPDQAKLRAGLTSAIITEKPNVKWNDVAGLESAKQALQEAVILPVKFPQFFTECSSIKGVGNNDQKVLVLAATNTPYALDQAIRRRFDKRIYIPLPDLKARQHMFKVHLGDTPHNLSESDFDILARRTEGFSGSDIAVCVKDVLFEPVRKAQDAMHFYKSREGMWLPCGPRHPGAVQTTLQDLAAQGLADKILPPPITRTDFDKVLARQRPTVSKADLEVHERFTKEFGEEG